MRQKHSNIAGIPLEVLSGVPTTGGVGSVSVATLIPVAPVIKNPVNRFEVATKQIAPVEQIKKAVTPVPVMPKAIPMQEQIQPVKNNCITEKPKSKDEKITREGLFKLYVLIDKQILKEAASKGQTLNGLGNTEMQQLDDVLDAILKDNSISFQDEPLNGLFDSITNAVKSAASTVVNTGKTVVNKVVDTAKTVVTKAAETAHKVITLPTRGLIELALKLFSGKIASLFVYALIPENHPAVTSNPKVKQKRTRALGFINILSKAAAFEEGYLLKHIRNKVVETFKITPEQFADELKSGKRQLEGLGTPAVAAGAGSQLTFTALMAAIVPILPFIPSLINAFKKEDTPDKTDFNSGNNNATVPATTDTSQYNIVDPSGAATFTIPGTDNPGDNSGPGIIDWVKEHPLETVGIAAATAGAGYAIYKAVNPEKKGRKKR